jgi:lipoyl(octanoyl) transferase
MITEVLTRPVPAACDVPGKLMRPDGNAVEWVVSDGLTGYPEALAAMKARAAAVAAGTAREAVWLVEPPPLYTAGTSAKPDDLLDPLRFPVFDAGRGGEYTYHGPGQRVAYLMLDLRERGRDIRCLVSGLEGWVIDTLERFNIKGERREGRIGVWVRQPGRTGGESKIAAIGVRVSKWVSFHGISLNIAPELSHYDGIVPCGISDRGVTSFEDLGQIVSMAEVDMALKAAFAARFGPVEPVSQQALVSAA